MKMMRTEFHYPAATQSVPVNFSNVRASYEFPVVAAFPLSAVGDQSGSSKRKAPYGRELYLQVAAEQQQTDFLENVIFAALGASGLVGVAVSLL